MAIWSGTNWTWGGVWDGDAGSAPMGTGAWRCGPVNHVSYAHYTGATLPGRRGLRRPRVGRRLGRDLRALPERLRQPLGARRGRPALGDRLARGSELPTVTSVPSVRLVEVPGGRRPGSGPRSFGVGVRDPSAPDSGSGEAGPAARAITRRSARHRPASHSRSKKAATPSTSGLRSALERLLDADRHRQRRPDAAKRGAFRRADDRDYRGRGQSPRRRDGRRPGGDDRRGDALRRSLDRGRSERQRRRRHRNAPCTRPIASCSFRSTTRRGRSGPRAHQGRRSPTHSASRPCASGT